jgi:hypothetical protein
MYSEIKSSKPLFDYNDFISKVNDEYFDKTKEYCEEIVKKIPKDKLLDTSIVLLKNINMNNFENISYLLEVSINYFDKSKKEKYLEKCSNALEKTDSKIIIKTLIIALQNFWNDLKKIARIRVEGMLIRSLENMEFHYKTETDENGQYYSITEIN